MEWSLDRPALIASAGGLVVVVATIQNLAFGDIVVFKCAYPHVIVPTARLTTGLRRLWGSSQLDEINCTAHGQHIFEYSPRSAGAADYAALTQRILDDE